MLPNKSVSVVGIKKFLICLTNIRKQDLPAYVIAGPTTFSVEIVNSNFEGLVSS